MVNMLHPILEDIERLKNTTKETLKLWGIGPWELDEWKEKSLVKD
jgi:hypothetical protein